MSGDLIEGEQHSLGAHVCNRAPVKFNHFVVGEETFNVADTAFAASFVYIYFDLLGVTALRVESLDEA